ncbi:glutamine cyclotransferase, partial [Bordetella pseudohinzii]
MAKTVHQAEILREYGPFEGAPAVHGVSYDGRHVWFATGGQLLAMDPGSGKVVRELKLRADAGTACDGRHLYQIGGDVIQKIDMASGEVVATLPLPGSGYSGLAWGEGSLWVGHWRERLIHEIDPASGAVRRSLRSDRFVTGVSWAGAQLWHGVWDDTGPGEIRRVDPASGEVLERIAMPEGVAVSGLESDGASGFFCGGGGSGKLR